MMAMASGELRRSVTPVPAMAPRLCSCGKPVGPDGECAACRAKRMERERASFANGAPHGHAFSALALFDGRGKDDEAKKKAPGATPKDAPKAEKKEAEKARCSPTWYGSTDPELNDQGFFTGKLLVTYNDAAIQSPCVKECVRQHEQVHVRDLTPIVRRIAACDRAAGNDEAKHARCGQMSSELFAIQDRTECNAYAKSIACLKAMLADTKGKCGKEPHRTHVREHLAREECHLAESCAAAKAKEKK
ncbi:MAG TPA: hypothetical protein VFJ16_03340 [Longimicrobium sp.]|nr:hypothetical protein [Longimicrobium sp.]